MSEQRPRYPEYRDSGILWLGEIPMHWERRRCRFLFREVDARSEYGQETHLSMTQTRGLIPSKDLKTKRLQSESYAGGKLCQVNDLVLNRLKAHLGVFAFAPQDGVVSPDYTVFRPKPETRTRYYEHLFKTNAYVGELRRRTKGIVEGFWRLYTGSFYDIPAIYPPPTEQDLILQFIEHTDRQIAKLIRGKRRLIELLNEQKQTIIHRAVTRGLNPDVPLKPSGIDWLGDVPAHWEVRPLKAMASVWFSGVDKHSYSDELPVSLCNYTDVYKNDFITQEMPFMRATATEGEVARFTLRVDDVLITKDSETPDDIGVPALVRSVPASGLVCAYHLAMIRPRQNIAIGEFIFRALSDNVLARQFHLAANGVTRFGLGKGDVKGVLIPCPEVKEQELICAHITKSFEPLDRSIAATENEIALIREYRDRLISDVVTGQIDVRGWQPPADEPSEDDETAQAFAATDEGEEVEEDNGDDQHE